MAKRVQKTSKNDTSTIHKPTLKKQKFVGTKTLVDPETGEAWASQINVLEDRDFNFHKVWLEHLVQALDDISNQRLRLAFWIIDHLDKENKLVMTQRAIAEKSGMGLATVTRTMKALQGGEVPFLQKINSGAYRVNPDVIFKGSFNNRIAVCYEYRDTQAEAQERAQQAQEEPPRPKAIRTRKPKQKPQEKPTAAQEEPPADDEPLPGQERLAV